MSNMEFPTRMSPTRAQRRQNTSCDPCRRSKRRCTLSPRTEGDSVICSNCRRLGHTCTFDFVNSRMRSVPQRKQKQTLADSSQFDEAEQQKSVTAAEAFTISNDDYQLDSIADPDVIDSWLNFDHGPFYDNNLTYLPSNIISPAILGSTTATPDDNPVSTQSTRSDATSRPFTYPVGLIVGDSLTSPIHLLSSRLDASILDDRLARIYDTIITGCSSRFLDSDCNLYTEDGKYKLEDGSAKMSLQSISNPGQIATGDVLGLQHIGHMTTLGIARFLDHFSDLYGNSMTPATRRQSDRILSSVLRTFALQWMPSESPDKTHLNDSTVAIFTDSWFRSRSLLKLAQSLRSYRLLYAILLFDAIAIPAKAAGSVSANEFLDAGLQNLCYLDGLVKQYCENLGPESKYRSLLEASLNIIRWGAYIRDTGASLTANRECKLPDVVSQMNSTLPFVTTEYASRSKRLNLPASSKDETIPHSIYQCSYRDLDRSIPNIYRKAFAGAFFVWRQIINTKNNLNKIAGSVSMLSMGTTDAMISAMSAVSEFNQWFRPFMSHCVKNFKHLSIGSKTYSVAFVAVWELGILAFIEKVKPALNKLDPSSKHLIMPNIENHQQEATSSMTQTVESVLALPTEEAFNLQNGLSADVPIISYHITPSLIATTIKKSIENIIDRQLHRAGNQNISHSEVQDILLGEWQWQIDILMKGLVALDVTVGGSQTAGVALRALLREYGDIMSECWSCDFGT